jgi:hypothetical protein
MTGDWLPIEYRDFWDVPRVLVVRVTSGTLLLECPFDEAIDAYAAEFKVYRLPAAVAATLPDDWTSLAQLGVPIGAIPVKDVRFDTTRRQSIEAGSLAPLLSGDTSAR